MLPYQQSFDLNVDQNHWNHYHWNGLGYKMFIRDQPLWKEGRKSRIAKQEIKLWYRPHKASGNLEGISEVHYLSEFVSGMNKVAGQLYLHLDQLQDESCIGKGGTLGKETLCSGGQPWRSWQLKTSGYLLPHSWAAILPWRRIWAA